MTTARGILRNLRLAGISIRADGRELVLKPAGKLSPELLEQIRAAKAELLHVLAGNYTQAAKSLVLRETTQGEQREELVLSFDERVAMTHIENGVSYGDACRVAYRRLCIEIETGAVQTERLKP